MSSCTLEIGGHIVARAEGGPFDAEYALFEAHEIELRSNNEPGTVREHGYRTTAELARERLEMDGVTRTLAEATAAELGALATAYARGPEVRRVVALLGPCELFEGHAWLATNRQYEGGWLDVAALAADCGVEGASRALQALHLASLVAEVAPDSTVYLATTEYTAGRRPGERTHRRVSLGSITALPEAIRALAESRPVRPPREGGPSRSDLLENVRARLAGCVVDASRKSLEALAAALSLRERPQRGPLADPDLWALELDLDRAFARSHGRSTSDNGDAADALEKLDTLERSRGRQPGTAYLRARAQLLLGREDPRVIAERASSLAMSMSSFAELELLAAEAWTRAGERKRALAYAHDLADNPQVDADLRARARSIVDPAPPSGPRSGAPSAPREQPPVSEVTASQAPPRSESKPIVAITAGLRASVAPPRTPSRHPSVGIASGSAAPSAPHAPDDSSWEPIAPTPIVSIGVGPLPHESAPPQVPSARPPGSDAAQASVRPQSQASGGAQAGESPGVPYGADHVGRSPDAPSMRPPAEVPPPVGPTSTTRPSMRSPVAAAAVVSPSVPRTSVAPRPPSEPDDEEVQHAAIRGGSQPPFRTEPPPANFPAAPLIPRLETERVEKAETLSLPPGLHGQSASSDLPTTPMEARVYFTHQARELGRLYRQRYNIELRTDLRSIELVQRNLAEHFETGELRNFEDVVEVRLHGAFLSELLARRLGAEWTDLGVSEMGYWAMNVPPGTTVWPIGRVVRFVTLQHRERDLVSYFLELQARAHGLK